MQSHDPLMTIYLEGNEPLEDDSLTADEAVLFQAEDLFI